MKKSKKISLIIAAILTVAGLVTSVAAFAMLDFDIGALNMAEPITRTHTVNEDFSHIHITGVEASIRILPSEDGSCSIICEEEEKVYHSVYVENGTLYVRHIDEHKWYERLVRLYWCKTEITLYLPEKDYGALFAETVSGNITLGKGFSFAGNVSLSTVSGNISADHLTCDKFSSETVSGNITLSEVNCTSFESETVSGESRFTAVTSKGSFEADSVSGNIRLDRCDAASLDLESVSGNVTGILLSPKSFVTETTSGRINVPKDSSGGKCEIETTSGNISFDIEE